MSIEIQNILEKTKNLFGNNIKSVFNIIINFSLFSLVIFGGKIDQFRFSCGRVLTNYPQQWDIHDILKESKQLCIIISIVIQISCFAHLGSSTKHLRFE